MSEDANASDLTHRILHDIQRELADMRDDRTVIVAILNRLDASVTSPSTEVRALRSQFDRFRNEVRERLEDAPP
jgi:HAMP domain-containing protein